MIAPDLIRYFAYFKHQCAVISELSHHDTEGDRVFHVIDTDEAYDVLKNKAKEKSFQFRLMLPTSQPTGSIYNVPINYGFIVTHFHSKREDGDNSFLQALSKSYEMGWRIINQIVYDAQFDRLFMEGVGKLQDLNLAVNPRISDIDPNYSGFIFTFDGHEKIKQCNADADRLDYSTTGGLTPVNFKDLYADSFNIAD